MLSVTIDYAQGYAVYITSLRCPPPTDANVSCPKGPSLLTEVRFYTIDNFVPIGAISLHRIATRIVGFIQKPKYTWS